MRRFVAVSLLCLSSLAMAGETSEFLPAEMGGLSACGPAETFAGKKLFDYMDGGAELYLAYGFTDMAVRIYQKDGRKVSAEIYHLGSDMEAFGIFSHGTKGEALDIGARASSSRGLLIFHQGVYFVRLVSATEPQLQGEALVGFARELAKKIPGQSRLPEEAALLPPGALAGSLRYLTLPDTARTVWLGGEGEALLSNGARAFSALFPDGDGEAQAVRVVYPDAEAARRACQALADALALKPSLAKEGCTASGKAPDESFATVAAAGTILRWASGQSEKSARDLLEKIRN